MEPHVSACYYYPLKSGATVQTSSMKLTEYGPEHDRMFMLVDNVGKFVSQRDKGAGKLALVSTDLSDSDWIVFSAPDGDRIELAVSDIKVNQRLRDVTVHGKPCHGYDVGDRVSGWFKHYLGRDCRLVSYATDRPRFIDPDYSQKGDKVGFADGMPLLIANTASYLKLSEHFPHGVQVPFDRFRPNIVIDGLEPFEEDVIHHLRIGEVELEFVKPCARCVMTTVDQTTGERNADNQPMGTLVQTRRGIGGGLKGVFFGQNAISRVLGSVNVGDRVEILSTRSLHPALEGAVLKFEVK